MSNILECVVYKAPSASGGKVWGCPVGGVITQTFGATEHVFTNQGFVTTYAIKPKGFAGLLQTKIARGYVATNSNVWIDFDSSKIYWSNPNVTSTDSGSLEREQLNIPPDSTIAIARDGLFTF